MKKEFIKNRLGQKIAVLIEEVPNQKGIVFIMHGLGGFKEQPQMETIAKTFISNGYTSVRFDTTNTIGESDGKYEDATTTNFYNDLEDVIDWAKSQSWYQEPFCLVGLSLGGICTALYSEKNPEEILALGPLSTVVSGKINVQSIPKEDLENWQKTGWRIKTSNSKPGVELKLKWSHIEDRLKYDLLPLAHKLTMPVLMVVGENDKSTPLQEERLLFEKLPGKKELHIIKDAGHTFRAPEHLEELKEILDHLIKSL